MSTKQQQNKRTTNKKNSNVDNDDVETQQQTKKQTTTKPNNKQTKKQTEQTPKEQKPKSQPLPKTQEIIGIVNGGALKGTEVIIFKDNGTYGITQFYNKLKTFYEFGDIKQSKFNCYYYPVSNCNTIYNQFIERCENSKKITDPTNEEETKNIINYKIIEDNDNIFNGMILIHCKNCTYIKSIIKELTGGITIKSYPEVPRISKPRPSNTKQSPPKTATSSKNNIIEDDNTTDDPTLKANITKNSRKKVVKKIDEDEEENDNEQTDSDETNQIEDNEEDNEEENNDENVEEDE